MEITAEGVQARLGGADILRGVDLRAGAGDFVGVIGPNGSGKSTLLKCIYRVLQPSAGAVYLDGRSLEACSFRESAKRVAVPRHGGRAATRASTRFKPGCQRIADTRC